MSKEVDVRFSPETTLWFVVFAVCLFLSVWTKSWLSVIACTICGGMIGSSIRRGR